VAHLVRTLSSNGPLLPEARERSINNFASKPERSNHESRERVCGHTPQVVQTPSSFIEQNAI
jgi:hypothetical protein